MIMELYSLILESKEIIKVFYALLVVLACIIIVKRSDRLFKLSGHGGIRYFRNAFFYFGIAFFIRYSLGFLLNLGILNFRFNIFVKPLFEFFLIMAGFFLIYSLIWKKFETKEPDYYSSLLNGKILIFYLMTLIMVVLDFVWSTYNFLFLSQIIIFLFSTSISYNNYKKKSDKYFPKFYFIAMLLFLIAWILNGLGSLFLGLNQELVIIIHLFNLIIFGVVLYGVLKVTRRL